MEEGIDYKYTYKTGETPVERLRNKISGLTTLIDLLSKKIDDPIMCELIRKTKEGFEDIRTLLDDAEEDYKKLKNS